MKYLCVFAMAWRLAGQSVPSSEAPAPAAERYRQRIELDFERHSLSAEAEITVRNTSDRAMEEVPVLLYRLMKVESATDGEGRGLRFEQKVAAFPEEPRWQVNQVRVKPAKPLRPGAAMTLRLKYAGALHGYAEVMRYVQDTVSERYTLIRTETMAYPVIARPTRAGWMHFLMNSKFSYAVETVTPEGYAAVCSSGTSSVARSGDGTVTHRCEGEPGSRQIDVAIARFRRLEEAREGLLVYALEGDAEASERVMGEMRRAREFYRRYLGESSSGGLTVVEIPDGWGSYIVKDHIFLTEASFQDRSRVPELYHEVAHRWNAMAEKSAARTRWFDEAFASYFEALALREFEGEEAFRARMERSRKSFVRELARQGLGRATPIAEYGRHEIGEFSYTKGAWSLHVLHQILGEEGFRRAMSDFLAGFAKKPAGFEDFRTSVERSAGRDVGRWFELWILKGGESSGWLEGGKSVEEMGRLCGGER